jgi:hypothetical protein
MTGRASDLHLGEALSVLRDATLRMAPQDEESLYAKKIFLILRRPEGPSRRTHGAFAKPDADPWGETP